MIEILKISLIAFMACTIIQTERSSLSWYYNLIEKLPWYLFKPLGGCYKCFTGQVCLWYFIFKKPFDFWELAFFVTAGIFIAVIYNRFYCWLDEDRGY